MAFEGSIPFNSNIIHNLHELERPMRPIDAINKFLDFTARPSGEMFVSEAEIMYAWRLTFEDW